MSESRPTEPCPTCGAAPEHDDRDCPNAEEPWHERLESLPLQLRPYEAQWRRGRLR